MLCSSCGHEIPPDLTFCPACGGESHEDEGSVRTFAEPAWDYRDVPIDLEALGDPKGANLTERSARLIRDVVERLGRDSWQPAGLAHAPGTSEPAEGSPVGAAVLRVRRQRRESGLREDAAAESGSIPPAVLHFRYGPDGTGIARGGYLRPGGQLRVEYDPTRLLARHPRPDEPLPEGEIIAHLRFHPCGQLHHGRVAGPATPPPPVGDLHPEGFEVTVPAGARQVELWFEYRGPEGSRQWDSRYGRNYWFDVDHDGVPPLGDAVLARPNAIVDPEMVDIFISTAAKQRQSVATTSSWIEARLIVGAWIRNVAYQKGVWIDGHVLDGEGKVVHAATLPLRYLVGLGPTLDLFGWEDAIYRGTGGGSGMGVGVRPDADQIQFRLYGQVGERLYTDGLLYQLDLPIDASVRQVGSVAAAGPVIRREASVPVATSGTS